MMTWEELMDRTSTTTTVYDIWNGVPELKNYSTSTNRGRQFKFQVKNQAPANGGDTSNRNQIAKHPQTRGDTSTPIQ